MARSLKMPSKLSLLSVFIFTVISTSALAANQDYEFDDSYMATRTSKTDLSPYSTSGIPAGVYTLDVYTNGEWKGRYELELKPQRDGEVGICYDKGLLTKFGVSAAKLNPKLEGLGEYCGSLKEWNDSDKVTDIVDKGDLRLDITVPQVYYDSMYRNYVSPEFWDDGIPAVTVGWNGNVWNSHYSSSGSSDTTTGFLGLNMMASYGGWALKHRGTLSWDNKTKFDWNSSQTYLQKAIPSITTMMAAGQISTSGEFFDSISLRGISLKTDDAMFPDSFRSFAPEISGNARTNALVTVRQSGSIIYQTTVTPGPFSLKDIYPSGYGNDLDVEIKESDGAISRFTVPYNIVPRLLRPEMFRYEFAVGKPDIIGLTKKPVIYQGALQYGLNNWVTSYAGAVGFSGYQSYLAGVGFNTPIGGFSFDVTTSMLHLNDVSKKGNMYKATYSKTVELTGTDFSTSAIKYSEEGFYDIRNALDFNDNRWSLRQSQKSEVNISVSQELAENWGYIRATGRMIDYWGSSKRDREYQIAYNNTFNNVTMYLSAERISTIRNGIEKKDNRIGINFSVPLNFGDNNRMSASSRTIFDGAKHSTTQLGLSGSVGDENRYYYGVTTTMGERKDVSANVSHNNRWASLNGSFSQGSSYRQTSISGSGTFIAHSEGLTFTPETGETLALIEAKNAEGAKFSSVTGTEIDKRGFAIVSSLRPYKLNQIEIDPKGISDKVTLSDTMKQIAPYKDSVVKIVFDTTVEDNLYVKGVLSNGEPLPFGSVIYNEAGEDIGTVTQGSMMFIRNASSPNVVIKLDNGECKLTLPKDGKSEAVCN